MEIEKLLEVPVPAMTSTYSPISNSDIHETILKEIKENGFELNNVYVNSKTGRNCIVMYGLNDVLSSYVDPEIGIRVGFRNSYDKTMSFGFALGSEVFICGNGMVSGEYTMRKKHSMRDLSQYAIELIHKYFKNVREEHNKNLEFAQELKKKEVDRNTASRLIGELFIDNKIITQAQLRKMTNEMMKSEKFKSFGTNNIISAWDFYNHGTEALKSSSNSSNFGRHVEYNNFFKQEFGIK